MENTEENEQFEKLRDSLRLEATSFDEIWNLLVSKTKNHYGVNIVVGNNRLKFCYLAQEVLTPINDTPVIDTPINDTPAGALAAWSGYVEIKSADSDIAITDILNFWKIFHFRNASVTLANKFFCGQVSILMQDCPKLLKTFNEMQDLRRAEQIYQSELVLARALFLTELNSSNLIINGQNRMLAAQDLHTGYRKLLRMVGEYRILNDFVPLVRQFSLEELKDKAVAVNFTVQTTIA